MLKTKDSFELNMSKESLQLLNILLEFGNLGKCCGKVSLCYLSQL